MQETPGAWNFLAIRIKRYTVTPLKTEVGVLLYLRHNHMLLYKLWNHKLGS